MLKESNEQLKINIENRLNKNYCISIFDEVKSTNTTLKEMAENGAEEGTIVIAHTQTEGRGMQGRRFYSPLNGLYISILIRPKANVKKPLLLTVSTAVAVVNAVKEVLGITCGIKWVNDIIYNNKKVGGILTEGGYENSSKSLKYAIVGIGLNLSTPKMGFPQEIADIADSLLTNEISDSVYCELVAQIVEQTFKLYSLRGRKYIKKYQRCSTLKSKVVKFIKNGKPHFGRVIGIDKNARLIVKEGCEKIKLCAGEVVALEKI